MLTHKYYVRKRKRPLNNKQDVAGAFIVSAQRGREESLLHRMHRSAGDCANLNEVYQPKGSRNAVSMRSHSTESAEGVRKHDLPVLTPKVN